MEKKKPYTEKLISVIIINWNGEKFLSACVESVIKQTHAPLEIIIADNASSDNSLKNIPKEIKIIRNETNIGFSLAANQGIRESKGEFVFVLNQDVTLKKDFCEKVYETFVSDETIGLVSGKILRMDGKKIDSTGQFMNKWAKPVERGYNQTDRGQFENDTDIFSVCGAVACYRRKMLEDIKLGSEPSPSCIEEKPQNKEGRGEYFDEDFFAFYEDLDLGWRAQLLGWKGRYNHNVIAYHYRGGTNSKTNFQILGRPGDIQSRIILNRYLMIIKNISKTHLILYSPFFFIRKVMDFFFIIMFNPRIFGNIRGVYTLFRSAFKKRFIIQNRRKISDKVIRSFIV